MASYLGPNDYSVFSSRKPAISTHQAALQEFATKNAYFQQGVAQIQSAYNNALNLNPQFKQNKDYLNAFMKKATEDIQKVVKSDIGVQDNAARASKIYQGIFDTSNQQNQLLLKDDQINKWYQEQEKLSNTARTAVGKNGKQGENWNSANDFYFRQSYNKYLKDAQTGDITKIEENFQNRKGFIPYYDYSEDMKAILKSCPPDSQNLQSVSSDPMYFQSVSSKGLSAAKVQNCMSYLPEAAKQQIGIEAYQAYYNNPTGLLNDYRYLVKDQYEEKRDALNAKLQALKLNPKAKKEDIDLLEQQYNQSVDDYTQASKEWSDMVGPSALDFINNNKERISSIVGFNKFTKNAGKTFQWSQVENKLSPNAVSIAREKMGFEAKQTEFLQGQQNMRLAAQIKATQDNIQLKHSLDMETEAFKAANSKSGTSNTNGGSPIPVGPMEMHDDEEYGEKAREEFNQKLALDTQAYQESENSLRNIVSAKLNKDPKTITETEIVNFIDTYEKSGGADPAINMVLQQRKMLKSNLNNSTEMINSAKRVLDKSIEEANVSSQKIDFGVTNSKGQKVLMSNKDLLSMMMGKHVVSGDGSKYRIRGVSLGQAYNEARAKGSNMASSALHATFGSDFVLERINPNGTIEYVKDVRDSIWGGNAVRVKGLSDEIEKINKKVNNAFGAGIKSAKGIAYPNIEPKDRKDIEDNIKTMMGYGGDDNIIFNIQYQDGDGSAYVTAKRKEDKEWVNIDLSELNIPDSRITTTGVYDENGKTHLKIPNLFTPLPGYVTAKESEPLRLFTENRLAELQNGASSESLEDGRFFEMTSKKGTPLRISVTKVGGAPVYKIYGFDNTPQGKEWIEAKNPLPITTPENLIRLTNEL